MPSSKGEIDSLRLIEFLEEIGKELPHKIVLVAAGGTAMTLLQVTTSTRDIDLTGPAEDIAVFKATLGKVPHGMKVDTWPGGQVFTQILPGDYLRKSKKLKVITNIELRALHPVDIVVSKLGRLDDRDEQDIEACIRAFKLSRAAVAQRASKVAYVGNPENFEYNIQYALRRFFPSK